MKKGLLAVFGFCACMLVTDVLSAVPVLNVSPMSSVLVQGQYGAKVAIYDSETGKKKNNLFSWSHGKDGYRFTYLGNKSNKRYDIFLGTQKVAEIAVTQESFVSDKDVSFIKDDNGLLKIVTKSRLSNDISKKDVAVK